MFRFEGTVFPIVPKLVDVKRHYNAQLENERIEYTKWSTIDKIDVAPWSATRKVIWINGGTMQSFIRKFDGNLARLKKIEWDPASLPFQVARNGSAVIIGSAGGYEVLCALSHGFKRIVAIEMDPVICELLKNEYADYTGQHLPSAPGEPPRRRGAERPQADEPEVRRHPDGQLPQRRLSFCPGP